MRTVALATTPSGYAALWSPTHSSAGPVAGPVAGLGSDVARLEGDVEPVRWVVWAARDLTALLGLGVAVTRIWDCAEVHRLRHGGSGAPIQDI